MTRDEEIAESIAVRYERDALLARAEKAEAERDEARNTLIRASNERDRALMVRDHAITERDGANHELDLIIAECDEARRDLAQSSGLLEILDQVLAGKEPDDFAASFPVVRKVFDLVRERNEALERVETLTAEVENHALKVEIQRLIAIAGEALGIDPSLRTAACVGLLAERCETLRIDRDNWRKSWTALRFDGGYEGTSQEILAASNADCACLRQLLRELRAANWYSTPTFDLAARIQRALGEE